MNRSFLVGLGLWMMTVLVFLGCLDNDFVNWDDVWFIVKNPDIQYFSLPAVLRLFTIVKGGCYSPLGNLNFMVDCAIWGLNPFGFHLMNVLWHAFNVVLVFRIGWYLMAEADPTARGPVSRWMPAAAVAALVYALHPLRVESVAWAVERLDVVSGFLILGAMLAYLHAVGSQPTRWRRGALRGLATIAFVASLLVKVSTVVLPVVLVLVDIYPLRRVRWTRGFPWRELIRSVGEKWVMFAAALLAGLLSMSSLFQAGSLPGIQTLGFQTRLAACMVANVSYLSKILLPVELTPLCWMRQLYSWDQAEVWWGLSVTAALTGLFFLLRRRCPGAFWVWIAYLVMINMYTGLLQAGRALMADRYTYFAAVPLSIGLGGLFQWTWNRVERLRAFGVPTGATRTVLVLVLSAILVLLAQATIRQVRVWSNSVTLWQQALRVDPTNPIAWSNLGDACHHAGRTGDALRVAWEAVKRFPQHANFWFDLGYFHQALGRYPQALAIYRQAIALAPDFADAYNNMGWVQARTGELAEAVRNYRIAQKLEPTAAVAFNIASCQEQMGDPQSALEGYRQAAEGGFVGAWLAWCDLTAKNGDAHRALEILKEGLRRRDHAALRMRYVERLLSVPDPREEEIETARQLLAALRMRVGDQSLRVLDLQKQMEARFPARR